MTWSSTCAALIPSPSADFYDSLLDNNFKGTYNIFRAARDAGCQRVIFASSVHAIEGYPRDRQLTPDDPVRPRNMYGVSKCFGEAVAHTFAVAEGLSSVCLRIGAYEGGPRRERGNSTYLSMFTSQRDLNSLILRSIEVPLPDPAGGSVVVHATSDNRFKRLDLTKSREVLGYVPQDDGFQLITFDESDEWAKRPIRRGSRWCVRSGARTAIGRGDGWRIWGGALRHGWRCPIHSEPTHQAAAQEVLRERGLPVPDDADWVRVFLGRPDRRRVD